MTKKYLTIPAVVAGALGLTAVAQAAEPTTADLQRQIAELKAQMAQSDKNAATARDVDATVESVLQDANDRSKLLAVEGITGGHNGDNFVLQSADGKYKLMPMLQFQFRYANNYISDGAKNGGSEMQDGFEIRRMKLEFAGNAISEDLKYNFRWASDDGGSFTLENAYVQYKFADDLAFRVGQYKDAVHHEELVSSKRQLAADRSLLNEILGGGATGYVQGVSLIWDNNSNIRGEVGFHDGANSQNTNYQNQPNVTSLVTGSDTDFGVSGRFEMAVSGGFKGYDQFTSYGRKEDALVLGVGGDWTQSGSANIYFHTFDVQWNAGPLAIYGAYVAQYLDSSDNDSYNWGALGQVGYLLNDQWEVFGRVDYTKFDGDFVQIDQEDYLEITGGVNYYLKGHNAKVTVDLTYLPNGSPADFSSINVLQADDEDEFVLRGQFQLLL